jgi:ferric-dicitrate binding protein FerR (iron transport regulator)
MSHRREITREFQRWCDGMLNGTLSEEDAVHFDRWLVEHPQLIEYFLDYCQLHIDLAIDLRADQALESFRKRQQVVAESVAPPVAGNGKVAAVPCIGNAPLKWPRSLTAYGIGICGLMLAIAGGLSWWISALTKSDRAPLDIAQLAVQNTPSITSVRLGSGTTTLELPDIGSVLVEGPADFELLGPMRARLNKGRIKVHVKKPSGYGFVVETPDGEVTDLGTEFGLDVASHSGTGLVVFQGSVDLRLGQSPEMIEGSRVERLFGGDGVRFSKIGELDRIMSIATGADGTFRLLSGEDQESSAIITNVTDNIRTDGMKKFYEIVPGGMGEDALAYVDRQEHEWNGLTTGGMPAYLLGADYVKPFNNDKFRSDIEIELTLSKPARLFIIFDDQRVAPPEWLRRDYQRFGDRIGLDMGKSSTEKGEVITALDRAVGPGQSIDQAFSIWERKVPKAGRIKLGSIGSGKVLSAMYGIAAVPLEEEKTGKGQ